MMAGARGLILLGAALLAGARLDAASIVFCSPGSPGDTAQAQPAMDRLARAIETSGGIPGGTVSAVYHEAEAPGVEAIRDPGTLLAAVPVPFFIEHVKDLAMTPRLAVVAAGGQPETYSLVARRGAAPKPAGLAGWEITGAVGYSPDFTRRLFGTSFGLLPADARVTFSAAPLQALRRAAAGERLAVVLDSTQSAALGSLPFGGDLEVLGRSEPMPAGFVCALKTSSAGAGKKTADALLKALDRLPKSPEGKEALLGIRVERFEPIDAAAVARLRAAYSVDGGARP